MLKNTKKICSVILALSLFMSVFVGCNSDTTGEKKNNNDNTIITTSASTDPLMGEGSNGTINLKVWAPEAAVSLFIKQCKQFTEDMKPYGDIKISVVPQGEDDAATNALTDVESAADVFGFACDNINKLIKQDTLLEIVGDDKTKAEKENSASSIATATSNGHLYAYPETGDNSYCLVYDKSVVSEEDAKTLEGVFKACKASNKKFCMNSGGGFYACLFLFTGGVRLEGLEDDEYETQKFNDYDEATVVKTMMAFHNLFLAYKDYFLNDNVIKIGDGFKSGTVGAGFDGSWNFKNDKEILGDRAGFAILPTINVDGEDRQIINMFGYKLIGVNAFTKYPATANELAKYLAGEKCQQERAEELNWGPSNIAVAESDLIKNDEAITAILAQAEYSVAQVNISPTLWSPLKTFGNKITDSANPMSESDCTELLHTTIANIRDE